MADRKITELSAMSAGGQATGDLLTIVDVSEAAAADKNKKMTMENLFKGIPGNVGIGESVPLGKLHVKSGDSGASSVGTSADQLVIEGSANTGMTILSGTSNQGLINFADSGDVNVGSITYDHTSNFMSFKANDAERMRINSSGNVGLGTSSPQRLEHLSTSTNTQLRVESTSASSNNEAAVELIRGSNQSAIKNKAGGLEFFTGGLTSERMSIDSTGRLLVNTTTVLDTSTPAKLHIAHTSGSLIALGRDDSAVTAGNDMGKIAFFGNDGGSYEKVAQITCEADGSHASGDKPGRLVFSTTADGASSPTERMRITTHGRLDVFASSSSDAHFVSSGASAGTSIDLITGKHSASSIGVGTNCFAVKTNGDVVNTNNSYGPLSSDERLKQDITDANSQWADIKNIRITNFHYKNDPTGHFHIGPIAQELEQVSPGLVTRRPVLEEEIADSSNDLIDGDEVLSFKASILYMKAVKALQEAMARIEQLEAKVAALEAG